jgi:hypothetical protein
LDSLEKFDVPWWDPCIDIFESIEAMNEWMKEWMNKRINERMNKWKITYIFDIKLSRI